MNGTKLTREEFNNSEKDDSIQEIFRNMSDNFEALIPGLIDELRKDYPDALK